MADGGQTRSADLVILGAGSGGYACALRAAELGLSVIMVERDKVGGTCLHRGCIPTKALLHAAEVADAARESEKVGVKASLDSNVADIANVGDRAGGMLVAGLFLKEFVPDGVTWAHLDVAGPAWNEGKPHGYTPAGGTGVPIRTLVQWLESL